MTPYLTAQGLAYGTATGRPLIRNLSFSLHPSEILVVTGPNGIGKTTLLEILASVRGPSAGSLNWSVKRGDIFYLPQLHNREFHIGLTLLDVLRFSANYDRKTLIEAGEGLLSERQLDLAWNTASGGERQKTLLIRALLSHPKVLLLDEPMNHLDRFSRQRFDEILDRFVKEHGNAVIMVGHHEEDSWAGRTQLVLAEDS